MSAELFNYIHSVKPSLSDEKRTKAGLLIMHYITLVRASDGGVGMDNVLTTSGKPFTRKVLAHMPLIRSLAFALKVDMTCPSGEGSVSPGLRRLCRSYKIDVEACVARHKNAERAWSELWDVIVFVRVALAVMAALHEDTLRELDHSYCGHRPVGYKPRSKWLGLGTEHPTAPVRARDLPRLGVGAGTSRLGPIRRGSRADKRRAVPYPTPIRESVSRSRPCRHA